jgi:hypothetical protein
MRARQARFVWSPPDLDKTPCLGTLVAPLEEVIVSAPEASLERAPLAERPDDLTDPMPHLTEYETVESAAPSAPVEVTPSAPLVGVMQSRSEAPPPHVLPATVPRRSPRHQVAELLSGFSVSPTEGRDPRGVARGLKQLAGVDLTPLPEGVILED